MRRRIPKRQRVHDLHIPGEASPYLLPANVEAAIKDARSLHNLRTPCRTLADMSEEEIRALERTYGVPVQRKKP